MKINEHCLLFETDNYSLSLIYRGNENILIKKTIKENGLEIDILVPRHELEKFMEIIQ